MDKEMEILFLEILSKIKYNLNEINLTLVLSYFGYT